MPHHRSSRVSTTTRRRQPWIVVHSSRTPASPASWPPASHRPCMRRPPSAGAWHRASRSRWTRMFGGAEVFAKAVQGDVGRQVRDLRACGRRTDARVRRGRWRAATASVEMAHTAPYYFFGKDETFALGCAIPFGLNSRQMTAWMYRGQRPEADARVLRQVQHHQLPRRQHGRADGRLVPQGDQVRRRTSRA